MVAAELSGYLFFALICLRCFSVTREIDKETDEAEYQNYIEIELSRRKAAYKFCHSGAQLVTVVLILSVFVHVVV